MYFVYENRPFMGTGPKIIVVGFKRKYYLSLSTLKCIYIYIYINFEVKHTLLIYCFVTCHHLNILDMKRLQSQSFLPNSLNPAFGLKNRPSFLVFKSIKYLYCTSRGQELH